MFIGTLLGYLVGGIILIGFYMGMTVLTLMFGYEGARSFFIFGIWTWYLNVNCHPLKLSPKGMGM